MSSRSVIVAQLEVIVRWLQASHILLWFGCAYAVQNKLRLLYRGSEHRFGADAFWQRCDGKANTLTVVKVSHLCSLVPVRIVSIEAACSLTSLSKAGLPPLSVKYDKTLFSGVDDGNGQGHSLFSLAELECYTLDA